MITYPKNWRRAGVEITTQDVETRIVNTLATLDCRNLAFSGGVDSSLLLYFLCEFNTRLKVFTIGKSDKHLDVVFAKKVVDYYRKRYNVKIEHYIYYPEDWEITAPERFAGDHAVELFYSFVGRHTDKIIAGDGIDEFMCGYYDHMRNPDERVYYDYLRRLQNEQLVPLDLNSNDVEVYLPYLDEKLIGLLTQIPLSSKVDDTDRKKFMLELAEDKLPSEIIRRRKYGFCDALKDNK